MSTQKVSLASINQITYRKKRDDKRKIVNMLFEI